MSKKNKINAGKKKNLNKNIYTYLTRYAIWKY